MYLVNKFCFSVLNIKFLSQGDDDMHNENEKVKSFKAYKRKKKNKNKRGIFKRKTGVLVIILIAAIGVGNLCIYQVSSKLKYQIYYLEKDLKKQKNKLETLQVEKLGKENTNTLEEDAIEKLNMIYPTDSQKIYISVDD